MRKTYRYSENQDYWEKRWGDIPADIPMENKDIYPLKYAIMTVGSDTTGRILEAGCGAGRVLRHYHDNGFTITGIDFIETAIDKLKIVDPTLDVGVGDITNLQFNAEAFDYILSFGLYHNLDEHLQKSLMETKRVLKVGGKVCASFRADNLQTKLTDFVTHIKTKKQNKNRKRFFHKMNLSKKEFVNLFQQNGFNVELVRPVENMPILYKLRVFRAKGHKKFNENVARSEGYKLSNIGTFFQKVLMHFFEDQFCNVYVLIATKR